MILAITLKSYKIYFHSLFPTIIPLLTSRTVNIIAKEKRKKVLERWRYISLQAAKQAHETILPLIDDVTFFSALLEKFTKYDYVLLPSPHEISTIKKRCKSITVSKNSLVPLNILLIIGPEGGFSKEELEAAKEHGAKTFSLGQTILKTDTAMIVSVGVINALIASSTPTP